MPYFHATFVERIPSILKHGLGSGYERNWPHLTGGLYLAALPEIAFTIMLERYMQFDNTGIAPKDELARLRVIVIDDSRIRPSLLRIDPEFIDDAEGLCWIYDGTIDVNGLPILDVDMLGLKPDGALSDTGLAGM